MLTQSLIGQPIRMTDTELTVIDRVLNEDISNYPVTELFTLISRLWSAWDRLNSLLESQPLAKQKVMIKVMDKIEEACRKLIDAIPSSRMFDDDIYVPVTSEYFSASDFEANPVVKRIRSLVNSGWSIEKAIAIASDELGVDQRRLMVFLKSRGVNFSQFNPSSKAFTDGKSLGYQWYNEGKGKVNAEEVYEEGKKLGHDDDDSRTDFIFGFNSTFNSRKMVEGKLDEVHSSVMLNFGDSEKERLKSMLKRYDSIPEPDARRMYREKIRKFAKDNNLSFTAS